MGVGIIEDRKLTKIFKKLTEEDRSYISGVCFRENDPNRLGSLGGLIRTSLTSASVDLDIQKERKEKSKEGKR